jgi:hypothetical protein
MFKKWILQILLISVLALSIKAQEFKLSNFISGNDIIRAYETVKTENGYYVYADYKGDLNRPEIQTADNRDLLIARYNDQLALEWVEYISGTSVEIGADIVVDDFENLYVLGSFKETCNFGSGIELISVGDFDVFLAKYNSSGKILWAKNIAYNDAGQYGKTIDFDDNDLIIGGYYRDSISFDNQRYSSDYGLFIAKFDTAGVQKWTKNITTTSPATTLESTSAFSDGYYFSGRFRGTTTYDLGVYNSNNPSYADVYIYKTDFDGNGQWLRRTYGDDNAFTGTMAQDSYGNIYITGLFNGINLEVDSTDVVKANSIIVNKGSSDIFVLKYNKNGKLIWDYGYGLGGSDWARDIKFSDNVFYITGYFSDTIIFDKDTLYSSSSSDQDAFIGAIDRDGNPLIASKIEDSDDNNESGMTLSIAKNDTVFWGGTFKSSSISIGDSTYIAPVSGKQCIFIAKGKAPLSIVFSKKENVSCNGQIDGELIVSPYFGVAPYNYSWSHNGLLNDSTASNLGAGSYTVTVTDANLDTDEVTYELVEPDPITFNPTITDIVQCSYTANGIIDVSIAGGNGGYEYEWQAVDGGNGVTFQVDDQSGLTIGTYNVTVTDSKGCTADTTIYITGPDPITFGSSVVIDSSSSGAGEIDLEIQGGSGLKNYSWEYPDGSTAITEDIVNLNTGNYTVTVTDGNLCEFDTLINVKNLDDFYIYITDFNDACKETISGRAKVSYSPSSIANITYQWDDANNQTTAEAINLAPGRYYHVTVTDVDLVKTRVDSVYIDELAYDFTGSWTGTSLLDCFGDSDGYIDLSITSSGGELPYSYSWTTGSTLQDITNLGVGNYSVTVTDKNSCTFSLTNFAVAQPTVLSAVAEIVSEPSCNGDFNGKITVDRAGGTSPYTQQWDDPGFQNTQAADGLDAGFYTVTVTDNNGCKINSSIDLTEPDEIGVTKIVSNETCNTSNDGFVNLTVSGGTLPFSYFWSTTTGSGLIVTDKDQSGLSAGVYYFIITDNNNCYYEDSVEITQPVLLEITNEEQINITTCNGDNTGGITITASGGTGSLTYTLNPAASQTNSTGSFTGLAAGTYTVYVEDESSCNVTSSSIEIIEPDALVLTTDTEIDAKCKGVNNGSVTISVSGGTALGSYVYNWTTTDGSGIINGNEDQPNLGAGTYNLTVTDDNSCEISSSYILTEPDTIVVSKTKFDLVCNGENDGGVNILVSGGVSPYSYEWSTTDGSGVTIADKNQTGLTAGKYNVTITDDNSCIYADSVEITQPPLLEITNEVKTDVTACNGDNTGGITITASGGTGLLTYTLNPGASQTNSTGTFTGLAAGTYTVYVEDESGCNVTSSNIEILEPSVLSLVTNTEIDAKCNGINNGSVTITVGGGTIATAYSFNWSTTDGSGIISGNEDQPNLGAGAYNLTVTDDNSCEISSSYILTEPDTIAVSKTKFDLVCNGESDGGVNISVSGGVSPYSYEWSTTDGSGVAIPDKNQTGLTAGNYNVIITDDNLCVFEESVEILEPVSLEITLEEAINGTSCGGGSTGAINISAIGGTGGLTYTLNPGAVQVNTSGNFTGIGTGTYIVEVEDDNACTVSSSSLIVTEPEIIVITTDNQSNVTCYGSENGAVEITVTGGTVSSDYTYAWSTDDGVGLVGGSQDQLTLGVGTYYLTVTDDNSCEVSTSYVLTEPSPVEISKSVYNAFCTGTNDGVVVLTITGGALPFSYFWTTIDGSGLVATNKHQSGLSAAMYYIRVDDANGCIYNDSVEIVDPPGISITLENSTDATDNNSRDGSVTIEATGGTPPISYTLNPGGELNYTGIFDDLNPGEYTVDVSDFNNCGPVESIILTVGSINSIYDILLGENILIYPNPTSSILFIDFDNIDDAFSVQIINISGQVVYTDELKSSQMEVPSIDMSNYSNGFYFIRIYNSKGSYQEKILLQ